MPRPGPWKRELPQAFQSLQHELNRLFDEYIGPARFGGTGEAPPMDLEPASWSPALDLVETPDAFILSAEVPGVDPSTIDLSVTGNVLSLRGVKPNDGQEAPVTLRERNYGPFHRQVVLSSEVNFEAAQADARNGVLKIRLPKKETAKPRTIHVQTT